MVGRLALQACCLLSAGARRARATALLTTPERGPWQSRLGAHSRCSPATGPRGLRDSLQVKCRELSFSGSLKVCMLIMSHLENKDTVKKIKAPVVISFRYIVTNILLSVTAFPCICVYIHTYEC